MKNIFKLAEGVVCVSCERIPRLTAVCCVYPSAIVRDPDYGDRGAQDSSTAQDWPEKVVEEPLTRAGERKPLHKIPVLCEEAIFADFGNRVLPHHRSTTG